MESLFLCDAGFPRRKKQYGHRADRAGAHWFDSSRQFPATCNVLGSVTYLNPERMSRFDRNWTMELNITWEQFRAAYIAIIHRPQALTVTAIFRPKIRRDFYGILRVESFNFHNRQLAFEDFSKTMSLEGRVERDEGPLVLSLRMTNYFTISYFRMAIWTLGFALPAGLVLARTTCSLFNGGASYFWYLLLSMVTGCCLIAWKGVMRYVQRCLDRRKELYSAVIGEIEAEANSRITTTTTRLVASAR